MTAWWRQISIKKLHQGVFPQNVETKSRNGFFKTRQLDIELGMSNARWRSLLPPNALSAQVQFLHSAVQALHRLTGLSNTTALLSVTPPHPAPKRDDCHLSAIDRGVESRVFQPRSAAIAWSADCQLRPGVYSGGGSQSVTNCRAVPCPASPPPLAPSKPGKFGPSLRPCCSAPREPQASSVPLPAPHFSAISETRVSPGPLCPPSV